jgi:hypothetical protein
MELPEFRSGDRRRWWSSLEPPRSRVLISRLPNLRKEAANLALCLLGLKASGLV